MTTVIDPLETPYTNHLQEQKQLTYKNQASYTLIWYIHSSVILWCISEGL